VFEEKSNLGGSPEKSEEWGRSVSSMTDSDDDTHEARNSKGGCG
jgi:hypothetical protein